jgi:hypothetical protein
MGVWRRKVRLKLTEGGIGMGQFSATRMLFIRLPQISKDCENVAD